MKAGSTWKESKVSNSLYAKKPRKTSFYIL